jgi:hypothetical protein
VRREEAEAVAVGIVRVVFAPLMAEFKEIMESGGVVQHGRRPAKFGPWATRREAHHQGFDLRSSRLTMKPHMLQ